MRDATFRDFKVFTRERLMELVCECESNLNECVSLLETLVEDARAMATEEVADKVSERHKKVLEVVDKATDLLSEIRL